MRFNLPDNVRTILYVLVALGTPVMSYLLSKNYLGELEMGLWSGLVTAISSMAALNVTFNK